jgi:hypothetical protein
MFATFSLSTWILASCAVLWMISIMLFFIFRLARRKALRRREIDHHIQHIHEPAYWPGQNHFGAQVHQELLYQHIDAVFNSLSAVVEAERLKLKALIAFQPHRTETREKQAPVPTCPVTDHMPESAPVRKNESREHAPEDSDLKATIIRLSNLGVGNDEIARQLGISRNEVLLATKMTSGRNTLSRSGRLSAVV